MAIHVMEGSRIVLIGGTGRSGTNLVKNVLLAQERCCGLPFESRFPTDPDGTVPTLAALRHSWSPYTAATAIERHMALLHRVGTRSLVDRLACRTKHVGARFGKRIDLGKYAEWELEHWFPGYWERVEELRTNLTAYNFPGRWIGSSSLFQRHQARPIALDDMDRVVTTIFSEFLQCLYDGFLRAADAHFYIDDNTFNIMYADWLYELLPNAVFVDVRRDPRDVVVSYLEQGWAPDTLRDAARYCKAVLRQSNRAISQVPGHQKVTVAFDDFAHNPNEVTKRIKQTIGMDSNYSEFSAVPMRPSSLGRWQKSLQESDAEWLADYLSTDITYYHNITEFWGSSPDAV